MTKHKKERGLRLADKLYSPKPNGRNLQLSGFDTRFSLNKSENSDAHLSSRDIFQSIASEKHLLSVAAVLIGSNNGLSAKERVLLREEFPVANSATIKAVKEGIRAGEDPLGHMFCQLRSREIRRRSGATYTPNSIVLSMLSWAESKCSPSRIVDPGAGSGRYAIQSAIRFPSSELIAIENDPVSAILLRANLETLGLTERARVLVTDYRSADIGKTYGTTLFIGNPPYVRHHNIPRKWKTWFADTAAAYGTKASKLAGLHVHFFFRTMQLATVGDVGTFITSAEWLDVNYGAALRELLSRHLGLESLQILNATEAAFPDATTTGAITCFKVGEKSNGVTIGTHNDLRSLRNFVQSPGKHISTATISTMTLWSKSHAPKLRKRDGYIELGDLFRVHRGQVTGSNRIWIAGKDAASLPPDFLFPTITRAREIFGAGAALKDSSSLRCVVDLPVDLDELGPEARIAANKFLYWAKLNGAHDSYTARHRPAWWAVNLRDPAPIICTYMARRSPGFVRNLCGARHINIAHGLYPCEPMSKIVLDSIATLLRANVSVESGRTYAGGLTKFEPKELERLSIPTLANLSP